MAFTVLEKLSRDTNAAVRSAVAVGARQFVSSSLLRDTQPVIPIREVFTGGVLSGLWFASEEGDDPVINQQYWNALRPITAFDAVHPLGFFAGEQKPAKPLARFLIRKILGQLAATQDSKAFADGIQALDTFDLGSLGHIQAALLGLADAIPDMKIFPARESRTTIERFRACKDGGVKKLAEEVLKAWGDMRTP